MTMRSLLFSALTTSHLIGINSDPLADRVLFLPTFGVPPTPQYSGYLDGTDGCDTEANGEFCKIHYWFHEAIDDEDGDKPVILWLNGGPGSSSILGNLQELGPLLMNATGGLMKNPYSWTNAGHLLVIESPIGVGFSYCANQDLNGTICENTDKFTASTARAALVDFFTTKFPELASRDFFITGESYAGVYIPTLAKEVLDNASDFMNLKGLAVGDPCTDNTAQADSMDSLWYAHKYGLVPDQDFDLLWHQCNVRIPNLLQMPFDHPKQKNLSDRMTSAWDRMLQHANSILPTDLSDDCVLAWRKFMLSSSHGLSQGWQDLYIDDYNYFGPVSSLEDEFMAEYLNRDDVQAVLHVLDTPLESWPTPPGGFSYTKEYDACNWGNVPDGAPSMIDFYAEIVPQLDRVWVYNGDTDPCVSYEGTRTAITRVGLPEIDGGSYRPWFYNHTAADCGVIMEKARKFGPDLQVHATGVQFGGEVVNYEQGLSFLTIHGSGHMVPQFRPQAALHMILKLVAGEELSPLLPTNQTLINVPNEDFNGIMNSWTEEAMGSPFVE